MHNEGLTIHYMEPGRSRRGRGGVRRHEWRARRLRLRHSDPQVVCRCAEAVGAAARRRQREAGRPERLLVFINPFGGTGRAEKVGGGGGRGGWWGGWVKTGIAFTIWHFFFSSPKVFKQSVAPLFRLSGISFDVTTTTSAGEALEALSGAATDALEEAYDGVVSVGGDGLFNEVIGGMLRRRRRRSRRCADVDDDGGGAGGGSMGDLRPTSLPLGIIPAGSTDSVSLSLHGTADVESAALTIVRGTR